MAYARPELSTHAMAADQPADDRCRMKDGLNGESRVHTRATAPPGGVLAVGAAARLPAFQRADPLAQPSVLRGQVMLA
jgi:hypothetical protein